MRHQTPLEIAYPAIDVFRDVADKWWSALATRVLTMIWEAYDLALNEVLWKVDWSRPLEDLEREITGLIEPRIQRIRTGDEPFYCQHGAFEAETRRPAPAQPPAYDFAFVLNRNERLKWPVEAKVLQSADSVADYVSDLRSNLLSGRYGPFTGEGAMLGYIRSGNGAVALANIAGRVPCKMTPHPDFKGRAHAFSKHRRRIPRNSGWVIEFTCHHLMMPLGVEGEE